MAHGRATPHAIAHHAPAHHATAHHAPAHHATAHHAPVHHAATHHTTHHATPVHAAPVHHAPSINNAHCQPHQPVAAHPPVCAPHPSAPPNAAVFTGAFFARKRREQQAEQGHQKSQPRANTTFTAIPYGEVYSNETHEIEKNMMGYQINVADDDTADSSCMPCCKRC